MRKLIAGMKISVDEKVDGPEGYADWVHAWSDDYDLTSQVDACLLGAGMYPGYEQYWTAVLGRAGQAAPDDRQDADVGWIEYARFAAQTPHYVLSSTLTSALWPRTSFVRGLEDIAASGGSRARTSTSSGALARPGASSTPGWSMSCGSSFIH